MIALSLLLPHPNTLEEISLMYGLNKFFTSKRNLVGKSFPVAFYIDRMKTGKMYAHTTVAYNRLNIYLLNRSMHQINEACNKLWSTLEVYHSIKSEAGLCGKFRADFLTSSTVPTLHYANISALLSILSLYGLSSIAERGRTLIFYNLVRTGDGMRLWERNRYLREAFGYVKEGWHAQVLQIYEGLRAKGIELPDVNLGESRKLQTERSKLQYDILGQTSMKGASGVRCYFHFLPVVNRSIEVAVETIHQVIKPIPNGCDSRFEELKNKIPQVTRDYTNFL